MNKAVYNCRLKIKGGMRTMKSFKNMKLKNKGSLSSMVGLRNSMHD